MTRSYSGAVAPVVGTFSTPVQIIFGVDIDIVGFEWEALVEGSDAEKGRLFVVKVAHKRVANPLLGHETCILLDI